MDPSGSLIPQFEQGERVAIAGKLSDEKGCIVDSAYDRYRRQSIDTSKMSDGGGQNVSPGGRSGKLQRRPTCRACGVDFQTASAYL
jgi:hypothetical protein